MRIMIFTQFFPPEIGATQTRLETFAGGLAERAHDVEVICEVPNHPQGVVHEGFRRRPVVTRRADGYRVTHVWVHTTPNKTTKTRLAFYGSYAAMATLVGAARPRPDVIFASSPPLPAAAAGAAVAARHRVRWVMDVRDLWPAAAVALGELSDPRALRMAEWLERRLYRSASAITVATEPFRSAVEGHNAEYSKVRVLPNGTTSFWLKAPDDSPRRTADDFPGDPFVWTYAGNIGPAQGLEAAVAAQGLLGPGFTLLIVGDGAARHKLVAQAQHLKAGSVIFRHQVPPPEARRLLWGSDALLVTLTDAPTLRSFVPSKLFDCCATGRPVIVAAAGEPQRLTAATGAALAVPPGDPAALASAVRLVCNDRELARSLSSNGRDFARAHLRENQVAALDDLLKRVASPRYSDSRGRKRAQ